MIKSIERPISWVQQTATPFILSRWWLVILLLIPLTKPTILEYLSGGWALIDMALTVLKVVSFLIIIAMYICRKKVSSFVLAFVGFQIVRLVVSIFNNNGGIWKHSVSIVTILALVLLCELLVTYSAKLFLKSWAILISAYIAVNFILLLFFPNGMAKSDYYNYSVNFISIDNYLIPCFLFGLLVVILYSEYLRGYITTWAYLLMACTVVTMLMVWSAGGMIGLFLFLIGLPFVYWEKTRRFVRVSILSIVYVVLTVGLVFFRVQNIFAFFIEDVLHKSLTLTGRTLMWDQAFELIQKSPLIGYGIAERGHIFFNNKFQYGHNVVIELLLTSGIIGLIAFIVLCVVVGRKLYKSQEHRWSSLATWCVFSIFFVMLIESYFHVSYFNLILITAYFIPEIVKQHEVDKPNLLNYGKPTKFILWWQKVKPKWQGKKNA